MSAAGSNSRAGAPPIAVGDTSDPTDASSFGLEAGEPIASGYETVTYRSAWWRFDPAADGWVHADTQLSPSSPDTILTAWADFGALREIGVDDQSGGSDTSKLIFYAYAGISYRLQVTQWSSSGTPVGAISYVLRLQPGTSTEPIPPRPTAPPPSPANDAFANAVPITYNSTSAPVQSESATTETGEPTLSGSIIRTVWWKYTATVDQTVRADLLQSVYPPTTNKYDTDTFITVYRGSSLGSLTQVASGQRNLGPDNYLTDMEFPAEAGTTYYIQVASLNYAKPLEYVLRLSKSQFVYGEWVQPPDGVSVFAGDSSYTVASSVLGFEFLKYVSGYEGYKDLGRAFGGTTPGTDPPAPDCAWSHARRYKTGSFSWWSINNGPSWNGTDPYQPAVPGYGTCPALLTGAQASTQTYTDHPTGYAYASTAFSLGYQDIWFRTYGMSMSIHLTNSVKKIGMSGIYNVPYWAAPWAPVLAPGESLVWESTKGTLTALDLQPTEPINQATGPTVQVDWTYSAACVNNTGTPAAARFGSYGATAWGPRWGGDWTGSAEGPEAFASQTVSDEFGGGVREKTLATAWAGAVIGWTAVDANTMAKALAIEESAAAGGDANTTPVTGGIRVTSLPTKAKSNTKPSDFAAYYGKDGQGAHYAYRHDVKVAYRVTVRPPRYRIKSIAPPEIINVDVLIQSEALTQALATSSGFAARGVEAGTPSQRVLSVAADWVQGYAGNGTQLDEPGVSQGVLVDPAPVVDDSQPTNPEATASDPVGPSHFEAPVVDTRGHRRSLVHFPVALPEDAVVRSVVLKVPWTHWQYVNGLGDLLLGWHDQESPPEQWTVGAGAVQQSTHEVHEEPLALALEWATSAVKDPSFRGMAIGPGFNDSSTFAGSTPVLPSQWLLEITYTSSEGAAP